MKFLIDGMLIKLGRYLRFLGFDAEIITDFSSADINKFSERIFLTVSPRHYALWPFPRKYFIQAKTFDEQLKEINHEFQLQKHMHWLTRCSRCNLQLVEVHKHQVEQQLPAQVVKNFEYFYQCPQCGKIYWEGGHVMRLAQKLHRLGIDVMKQERRSL